MSRGSLAIFLACLASIGVLLSVLATAAHEETSESVRPEQVFDLDEGRVALQPYGAISGLTLGHHALLIERRFGVEVEILPPRPLPTRAWSQTRRQVEANVLLDDLYIHKPQRATHVVGVLAEDLYTVDWDWLYGFGQVEGRVAVYSLQRLDQPDRGLVGPANVRAEKILVHEIGHTLGLEHCDEPHCAMATVEQARGIERMSRFFCRNCAHHLRANVRTAPREDDVTRGDGLYARGSFTRAWMRYTLAAMRRPTDPARLNRVGVAGAELGSAHVAERSYRLSILLDPEYALPYYNYGLLYAPHDVERSKALLRAGFRVDPDRVEALGFLGSVYADVLHDEHRALAYFRRYVREGGQTPSVLFRYRRLMRPAIFEFDDGEVGVIRGQPDPLLSWLQRIEVGRLDTSTLQ